MNEQIQTLIENLEDSRKRVRQKAVENVIKLIQQNDVHTNQLKNALLGNNLDLTSWSYVKKSDKLNVVFPRLTY